MSMLARRVGVHDEAAPAAPDRSCRVLLVEDNANAAHVMSMVLKLQGHEVQVAQRAEAALAALRETSFDVVLSDLGLPEMDGYQLAKAIRADEALREVGLIAVSGYGQLQDRERALAAGFDEHLVKPVDREMLEQALAAHARH